MTLLHIVGKEMATLGFIIYTVCYRVPAGGVTTTVHGCAAGVALGFAPDVNTHNQTTTNY